MRWKPRLIGSAVRGSAVHDQQGCLLPLLHARKGFPMNFPGALTLMEA